MEEYYFGLGDFSFMSNKFEERYLTIDFKVVNSTPGIWDILKGDDIENNPVLQELRKECWQDHTTKTFIHSMKQMKLIDYIGWDKYANGLWF